MATQKMADEQAADYADQFNAPDAAPTQQSEDEAFSLGPEQEAETPAGAMAEPAGEPMMEASGEPTDTAMPPADAAAPAADPEQRLRSWEGRLKAKEAELAAKEAAMGSTNVNDMQSGDEPESMDEAMNESPADEAAEESDPATVLAEDFGQEFVTMLTKLIQQVAGDGIGGISATVTQLISDLRNRDNQSHYKSISGAHADFMEVVESPEFAAWKAAQPDQPKLQAVIDSGSAEDIIAMLTEFKNSRAPASSGADDEQIDAAEGVRSGGITLPKEPGNSQDFADAWNEA